MRHGNVFSMEHFREPPALLWPGYFWVLNDRIDEKTLLDQLHDMYDHGARSLCLLAEPPEFRPRTFGTELDLPYLGEAYFAMIEKVLDECEELGMKYWLYDEGGWPSGGACGQVLAQNPDRYVRKTVEASEEPMSGNSYVLPTNALGATVGKHFYKPGETIEVPAPGASVRVFRVKEHPGDPNHGAPHPNLLVEDATKTFIEKHHHRYCTHHDSHLDTRRPRRGNHLFLSPQPQPRRTSPVRAPGIQPASSQDLGNGT